LLRSAGISVNKWSKDWSELQFPILARLNGLYKGKGITLCMSQYEAKVLQNKGVDYFSEFTPVIREYRVHVVNNGSNYETMVFKKILPRDCVIDSFTVKNLGKGWRLTQCDGNASMKNMAIESIKALGLDFGAVDIIHNIYNDWVVLEVNTAPGLTDKTGALDFYAENLNKLIGR
jgi:D-alanine-D-alanine ligase-like ATP-grasp enzyme